MIDKISSKIQAKQWLIEECERADNNKDATKHFRDLHTLVRLRTAYKEAVDRGLL